MIGIQPSPIRAARFSTASEEPPNQTGIGRCTGKRQDVDGVEVVEAALEGDEVLGPEAAHHLDLLGLAGTASVPLGTERLIFDVVPADADAEAQPTAA
jgi:hypothetical protein